MNSLASVKSQPPWLIAFSIAVAAYWAVLLGHHLQLILEPMPLDLLEPAMHIMTGFIAQGGNPYAFDALPIYANNYPSLPNLVAVPFTWLFDNGLVLHRSLSAIYIALCCLLSYQALRKLELNRVYGMAGAGVLYAALLHYNTPTASVNALGQLLFTFCVLYPLIDNFSRRSLALSACAGALTFYCKQYYLLGPGIVGLYLLFTAPFATTVRYGVIAGSVLAVTLAFTLWVGPYYLDETLFGMKANTDFSSGESHLPAQLRDFGQVYAGLLLALLVGLAALVRGGKPPQKTALAGLAFVCGSAAIVFILGHNRGNYLTYLFQLMSPFLILTTLALLTRHRYRDEVLVPALLFSFWMTWQLLPSHASPDRQSWDEIRNLISQEESVLTDGSLAHLVLEEGKTLHQGPLTRWFHYAQFKPEPLRMQDPQQQVTRITADYIRFINTSIAEQAFDLVLLRPRRWDMIGSNAEGWPFKPGDGQASFKANYRLEKTLQLQYPQRLGGGQRAIEVWRPMGD